MEKPEPEGIWVSEWNRQPPVRGEFRYGGRVRFYDATLRDGEQAVGVVLSPEEKLEIARQIDALGISRIEAGFPRVSPEDAEAISLIASAGLAAEIWGFSRALRADVDALVALKLRHAVIEAPTSDVKMRAYGLEEDAIRKRVQESVAYASQRGIYVAFFAVDGSRTRPEFLREIYGMALEAGAQELVIVDTLGACAPEAVELLVGRVREWVGASVPLHFHGHNDFGMATASAVAAVRAGAEWIQGTINGMGERAGNADLGEVALALECLYRVPVEIDTTRIRQVSELVRRLSGCELEPWKPVVGRNLFMRESGAIASQFDVPEAIEPFSANLVGATRTIVLGKKSGLDSVRLKCRELGIEIPMEMQEPLLAAVKQRAKLKRGLVTNEEFREMVRALERPAATQA